MRDKGETNDSDVAGVVGLTGGGTKGRKGRWLLVCLAFGAAVFGALLLLGRTSGNGKVQYRTQPVTLGDLTLTVNATGTLEPTNQVEVGSELSGIIKSVAVDYNSSVSKGQVLARLDTEKLAAEVLQAEASLASARATGRQVAASIREAQNEVRRLTNVRRLTDNRAVSQHEMDAAQAALDRAVADKAVAQAAVAKAQASLNAIRTDLGKAEIRSPVDGIVLTREVDPGQTVAASLSAPVLFTLAENLTQMALHVYVDEADVGQVAAGQSAVFTVDAYPDKTFPARITQVRYGAVTTAGVVTYETVLAVDNSSLLLRPGMTATASITVQHLPQVKLAPNAAFRFAPNAENIMPRQSRKGFFRRLLPGPPSSQKSAVPSPPASAGTKRVWVLKDGAPVPVPVAVGQSDGSWTHITGQELHVGTELVVGSITAGGNL